MLCQFTQNRSPSVDGLFNLEISREPLSWSSSVPISPVPPLPWLIPRQPLLWQKDTHQGLQVSCRGQDEHPSPLPWISSHPLKELPSPSQFGSLMLLHVCPMGCVHFLESSLPLSSRIRYPLIHLGVTSCTSQPPGCYFPSFLGSGPSDERACPWSSNLEQLGEKSFLHTSF